MSVGFGFSAGDFIATLQLVSTITDALRSSGNSSQRYRELIRELHTLETALIAVKQIELHESQSSEMIALQFAASQCRQTIDEFWKKTAKYQPCLGNPNSGTPRLKEAWMKVKWAVFEKEDVDNFKADLRSHTGSIQLLIQVNLM